ncbi:MAG TPA: hypothetical protein VJ952_12840 [Opitutales bacterium]|nr:hypothetical protein [Opitutales bacterium]
MEIAQTNLQLYNQLGRMGWDDTSLIQIRHSYDLVRALFGCSFRPSHKPFICHLVGTASVLAHWGERPGMVVAGLLHSAYLYGNFGDRAHGVNDARRQYLEGKSGAEAEGLVYTYTIEKGCDPLTSDNRDFVVLCLADLYDELLDLGPAYTPAKIPLELENWDADKEQVFFDLVSKRVGPEPAIDFQGKVDAFLKASICKGLQAEETASFRVKEGVPGFKKNRKKNLLSRILGKG